jgi:hypothetical protein
VRFPTLLFLAAACATRVPPSGLPPADGPAVWRVGVVVGSGDRLVSEVYTLIAAPKRSGIWAFSTEAAEGTWEERDAVLEWDSTNPRPDDPWPLLLQHAVSGVPAAIRFDALGRPQQLAEADAWRRAARSAMERLDLPAQARASADALLDPVGIVRDLQRSLPGVPPDDTPWRREEQVAGILVDRVETCERRRAGPRTTYRCEGTLEPHPTVAARLFDATSHTTLVVDARGLVQLDTSYEATMVVLDASGTVPLDRPIAGRRQVVRQ